nr:nitrogen fixation protein NifA [Pseudobdellovibrionaceae bacterium]
MINWGEFEHIHVIKKLKQILNSWWNIEVVFTSEGGELRGYDISKSPFKNPSVGFLISKEGGQQSLKDLVTNSLQELKGTGQKFTVKKWDLAGYDVGVFPIYIENDCVGTVVAMGFLTGDAYQARLQEVRSKLSVAGLTTDAIEKSLAKVKYL